MAKEETKKSFRKDWLPLIYLVVALLALRWTVVEPYVVPTGSMEPTLKPGDRLYALKCAYDVRLPFTDVILFRLKPVKRGDVILFRYPKDPSITFVKRALAVSGDTVEMRDGAVFVNNQEVVKAPLEDRSIMYDIERNTEKTLYLETLSAVRHYVILDNELPNKRTFEPITVPQGYVFAVGDNRDNSSDSRFWGFVPEENLKGQAMFIWYSSFDKNIRESPDSSLFVQIMHTVFGFFQYIYDMFTGDAHVRPERVGTLIQ